MINRMDSLRIVPHSVGEALERVGLVLAAPRLLVWIDVRVKRQTSSGGFRIGFGVEYLNMAELVTYAIEAMTAHDHILSSDQIGPSMRQEQDE